MKLPVGSGITAFILSVGAVLYIQFRSIPPGDGHSLEQTKTASAPKRAGDRGALMESGQKKGDPEKNADIQSLTDSVSQKEAKAILADMGPGAQFRALATKAALIGESTFRYRCLDEILRYWLLQNPVEAESWYDRLPRGKCFDPLAQRLSDFFLKIDAETAVTWTLALSDLEAMGASLDRINAYWGDDASLVNALIQAGLRDKPPVVIAEINAE